MTNSSPCLRFIYAAVAATTMATLLFELTLTRIFSVVLFYHFAFMAISIALFGLGAGGIFSYAVGGSHPSAPVWRQLGKLSIVNVAAAPTVLIIVLHQQVSIHITVQNALKLALIYFVSSIPFFFAGIIVSLAISATMERVHKVYFFDLLGAAGGCLLLVPLLNAIGGPNTVLAASILYGIAGAFWWAAAGCSLEAWVAGGSSLVVASLLVVNLSEKWIDVHFAKGQSVGYELFSRWNSFSRVGVAPDDGAGNLFIRIDADAATSIPGFSLDTLSTRDRNTVMFSGPGLPYLMQPGAKALIIGPGGGFDVARALLAGSSDITGVEINPIIADDIMRGRFAAQSRNLYLRPEVRIQIEDGRSFVRRSREKYQVIQMTLVDTWASTAAGAFALSENNLYTSDAIADYLKVLTDDGLLAITRWEFDPPRESLRVVSLGLDALQKHGAPEPWRHFVICRENSQDLTGFGAKDTVIIKRSPFTSGEIARAREIIRAAHLQPVYLPGERIANPFTSLLRSEDPARFQRQYQYDIMPVSDNRPFFFYTVRPGSLWNFLRHGRSEDVKINVAVMMLFVLLAVSIAATAIILLLPPLVLGARVPGERPVFLHLAYFFAIGMGYIMVEVALIQKFVLFLGRPSYSLTVVVFSLLVASGIGSYTSVRFVAESDARLRLVLLLAALAVAAMALTIRPALDAAVALPLAAKCTLAVAFLFPAGYLMGMPFPSGLKRLQNQYPPAVRWAWATNSASSVLGSVTAIFLAIHFGLMQTLLLGGASYMMALGAVYLTPRPRWRPSPLSARQVAV